MMDVLVGAVSPHHQQKEFINNQMTKITDEIIVFLLMLFFIFFEEVQALLTPEPKRILPTKKTKTELKRMLKNELVELVIAYQ
tara:strand:- start:118 stop:366 length:249 start_codon:yes stop_codon:yes gene_type:complete